jgi:hypothetical protein
MMKLYPRQSRLSKGETRFQIVPVTTMALPETPDAVGANHRSAMYTDGISHVCATNRPAKYRG